MKELVPGNDLGEVLEEFIRAGGAIDFILIDPESASGTAYDLHRNAALFGVRLIYARASAFYERARQRRKKGIISFLRSVHDFLEFVVKRWSHVVRRKSIGGFRGDAKKTWLPRPTNYFWVPEDLRVEEEKVVGRKIGTVEFLCGQSNSQYCAKGFEGAFFDPPYHLELKATDGYRLYRTIKDRLFGELEKVNEIYAWSTDWSNYFDEGHQWWGAFLWTLQKDANSPIIWVGASASD